MLALRAEVRASPPPTLLAGAPATSWAEESGKQTRGQWGKLRDEVSCRRRYRTESLEPAEPTWPDAVVEEGNRERWDGLRDEEVFCRGGCCRTVLGWVLWADAPAETYLPKAPSSLQEPAPVPDGVSDDLDLSCREQQRLGGCLGDLLSAQVP